MQFALNHQQGQSRTRLYQLSTKQTSMLIKQLQLNREEQGMLENKVLYKILHNNLLHESQETTSKVIYISINKAIMTSQDLLKKSQILPA